MNAKIKKLQGLLQQAHLEEEKKIGNKKFRCVCGRMHFLRECRAVQNYYYSYNGEDSIPLGFYVVCPLLMITPETRYRAINEIVFDTSKLSFRAQVLEECNPEIQFRRHVKRFFKSVEDGHCPSFPYSEKMIAIHHMLSQAVDGAEYDARDKTITIQCSESIGGVQIGYTVMIIDKWPLPGEKENIIRYENQPKQ